MLIYYVSCPDSTPRTLLIHGISKHTLHCYSSFYFPSKHKRTIKKTTSKLIPQTPKTFSLSQSKSYPFPSFPFSTHPVWVLTFHPTSASAVWALTHAACFLVGPGYGLAGESGLLPPAECWGGMQGACCLRSTLAVCPGDKPRSEFTTRPPQHSDKGTHAQRGQETRQDKPYPGPTRKHPLPYAKPKRHAQKKSAPKQALYHPNP